MSNITRPFLYSGLAILALLSACATAPTAEEIAYETSVSEDDIIPASAEQRAEIRLQDPMTQATFWGIEYEKNPGDVASAIEFARSLRAIGSNKRAAEVASQTLALAPDNVELQSILGKSLLSAGDPNGAVDALRQAYNGAPDELSLLAALGVAYDQSGRHREAQATYQRVLELNPNATATLSNLGLSLALTGNPEQAETYLRQAVSQPDAKTRERQNLAMVLSLQGKFEEARQIGSADLPDAQVDRNINYFRAMLTPQSRRYGQLRGTNN